MFWEQITEAAVFYFLFFFLAKAVCIAAENVRHLSDAQEHNVSFWISTISFSVWVPPDMLAQHLLKCCFILKM